MTKHWSYIRCATEHANQLTASVARKGHSQRPSTLAVRELGRGICIEQLSSFAITRYTVRVKMQI